MAKQIEFESLFNKGSFDAGVADLVKVIGKITEEIELAELAGKMLSETLGKKLKTEISALSSVSKTLSKDLLEMTKKMEDYKAKTIQIDKITEEYKKETEKLTKELEKLKLAQEKANKETEKAEPVAKKAKNVYAGLSQSLLGVASGAAIVFKGISFLGNQLISATQSAIAFEKVMKEVEAVSGASGEELKLLANNANKLGSSTEKTAQQVAEAQKELAKLGFTTPEILLATEAIVNLSTATGEDLVKTAEVAASTIRSFGLEVSDLTRVTDVMTKSFIISALDLEKFRESVKLVAPIAAATGVGIESVTAGLAKLADTGISGSLAGTAMRNLLSSMADPTEDLVKFLGQYDETLKDGVKSSDDFTRALQVLKGANVDLETAVGMVDVRARTAFFTLVNYADDVEDLAVELRYLDGETKEVAKSMRDQLANDILIAESAFDSLRRNGIEPLLPVFRSIVQDTTEVIEGFRFADKAYSEWLISLQNGEGGLNIFEKTLQALIYDLNLVADNFLPATLVKMGKAGLIASNDLNQAGDTFNTISTNVEGMIKGFKEFDQVTLDYQQSVGLLNTEVTNEAEGVIQLRALYPKLSAARKDARDFLVGVRMETKESISATNGYIEGLKGAEITLKDLIKVTEEQEKATGKTTTSTQILTNANNQLLVIEDLRISQEEKLCEVGGQLNKVNEDGNDGLEDKNKLLSKLIKLRGQLSNIENQTKEDQVKIDILEEESLLKKLPLIEKLKNLKIKSSKETLSNELQSIEKSDSEKEEKDLERAISFAKHKRELLKIDEDYYKEADDIRAKMLAKEILLLKAQREEYSKTAKDIGKSKFTEVENDITKSMEAYEKILLEADKKKAEYEEDQLKKGKKTAEEEAEERIKIAEASAQALSMITTGLFDKAAINRSNELTAIDAWEQERVKLAGDNDEAIAAIEKEAQKRRNKIKLEQAKADKKEAIFQILIQTAVNIVKAWKNPLEMILAGALGAIQVAMVAARPLPKFAKGTNFSPEGHAIVGERGRELIKDGKSGNWRMSSERASQTYLSRGSKVIPAHITAKLLEGTPDHNGIAEQYLNRLSKKEEKQLFDYNELGKQFKGAVADIPVNQTNFDENGVTRFTIKRNSKVQRLNKRY